MSEDSGLKRTALYDLHREACAKMVEFGGWQMPVQYTSIIGEHRTVREAAGFFDLSHMGRVYVSGTGALPFLQALATNDAGRLAIGQVQYSLICNRDGGVRDDILVYRLAEDRYLLVVNASNRLKVLAWMEEVRAGMVGGVTGSQLSIEDRTEETVMIGVQGPHSVSVLQPLVDLPLDGMGYYHVAEGKVLGGDGVVSRTGYTGEDGFELAVPAEIGRQLWRRLMEVAMTDRAAPAGLGARDTLRLEAGMPLYGHELGETVAPLEVGLARFVHLEKPELVGREALCRMAEAGPPRRLVGLEMPDRAIGRQGAVVVAGGLDVGRVTSGSFSPTLDRSIAMALVAAGVAGDGPDLGVVIRGAPHPAKIVDLPFYRRKRK